MKLFVLLAYFRMQLEVDLFEDECDMGFIAASWIAEAIEEKPDLVLGLCTGGTPVPIYRELVSLFVERKISFSEVKTFNLDEYYPIHPNDPDSFWSFMHDQLFNFIDIKKDNIFFPNSLSVDPQSAALRYEKLIASQGGIDLLLTGIGENTHIGFNEPSTEPNSKTRLVELSEETRQINARFFDQQDDVPSQAITMGLSTILSSKKIILCASGRRKAPAIRDALLGQITPSNPGSYIQTHNDVKILLDLPAASLLKQLDEQ